MRFACYSVEGTSLAFWKRLKDEGHQVLVYIERPLQKHVGEGIVPRSYNYAEWAEWGRNGIYFFDCTDAGRAADVLRKAGRKVVGGGGFCDRLEKDRAWGLEQARSVGMDIPATYPFPTVTAAIKYIRENPAKYYFKPDRDIGTAATTSGPPEVLIPALEDIRTLAGDNLKNILQEKLNGFALSTARYWNGSRFTGPYEGTIEHKALMDGDIGPATGCSFNLLWFYHDEPYVAKQLNFSALAGLFQRGNAPPGIYDVNALLNKKNGKAYFLEWTPRLGFDAEPTALQGIKDYGKLLSTLAQGGEVDDLFDLSNVYASVRLGVPPYPLDDSAFEHIPEKKTSIGKRIIGADGLWDKHFLGYRLKVEKGQLCMADASGMVGLSMAKAANPTEAFGKAYDYIKKVEVSNLMYRTDALKCVQEDLRLMVSLGYDSYR